MKMQTTYTLSEKELNTIITEFFRRKGKTVKSTAFHKSQADRPCDSEHFYATVSIDEALIEEISQR